MRDELAMAVELHQQGRLGEAAAVYEQVLARGDENPAVLHLLGVLHHQRGDYGRAIELMGRAVALRPNVPAFHANLGESYRAAGQFERAVGCCRAALGLRPEYPEALCNLGLALQGLGWRAEAVGPFRRALELRPAFAAAHNNLGIVLRELGRGEEALGCFRRAVEVEPEFAPALANLGQVLVDRGQAEEALPHCREAVRRAPDMAALHNNLGNALRALERHVEARGAYLEALRLEPELAPAHAHLALTMVREGEAEGALPWAKRAVELEPANAVFREILAEVYVEREAPGEAIEHFERALALAGEPRPGVHLALGWALQEEGRLEEARAWYGRALELQPDSAAAYLNLGGLAEVEGRMGAAEAAFRTALRLDPDGPLPHARLATLLRGELRDDDLEALERRLGGSPLAAGPRARLLFGLAHVLDARGDHARAAACLGEANGLVREQARGSRGYEPEEHERFIDRLIGAFDGGSMARNASLGADSRRPVFIFGLPRSGTTLVEQVLSSHSRVHGGGETRMARKTFESIPATLGRPGPPIDCAPLLDGSALGRLGEGHLERLLAVDDRADRVTDKMPDNYMYLGFLALVLPRATFIHCRRDFRDTAVSCWMTDFRSIRWANDPGHIASRFRQYRRIMDHWEAVVPVAIHHVDYEETVEDFETVARRLVAACGLAWEPACLEFHRSERPIRTASLAQVRQPVYTRSVARWRKYEAELGELFAGLPGPWKGGALA